MDARTVLVITKPLDVTADLVVKELGTRGVPVMRFDLGEFPESLTTSVHLGGSHADWSGVLRNAHRDVDLAAIGSAWYRKPSTFRVRQSMNPTEQNWAIRESRMGFGGLLASLPVHWVNHPHRLAAAGQKPHQLAAASRFGLTVPESLVTNDPAEARSFCVTHTKDGVVYKALSHGPGSEAGQFVSLHARRVHADGITEGVARAPHLFQRAITGYAVRLTVVGRRIFAVRLGTPAGRTELDWRNHNPDDLRYTPVEVPEDVARCLNDVMDYFGLVYAAPDFIVDMDGRWWFIGDLNPGGQWGWIAHRTGLPIATALADELTMETLR
jgi:ATP-grasp ribosomal peptide maturase